MACAPISEPISVISFEFISIDGNEKVRNTISLEFDFHRWKSKSLAHPISLENAPFPNEFFPSMEMKNLITANEAASLAAETIGETIAKAANAGKFSVLFLSALPDEVIQTLEKNGFHVCCSEMGTEISFFHAFKLPRKKAGKKTSKKDPKDHGFV